MQAKNNNKNMMLILMTMISEPPGEIWTSVLLALKHISLPQLSQTVQRGRGKVFFYVSHLPTAITDPIKSYLYFLIQFVNTFKDILLYHSWNQPMRLFISPPSTGVHEAQHSSSEQELPEELRPFRAPADSQRPRHQHLSSVHQRDGGRALSHDQYGNKVDTVVL